MANDNDLKYKAITMLNNGSAPKDITSALDIPYSKVLRWRKELQETKTKEDVQTLIDVDQAVVHRAAEIVKDEFEEISDSAGELVSQVVSKVDGLQLLNDKLQSVGLDLATHIEAMAISIEEPKDLMILVDSLSKLQTAFFSKGNNVNILNANGVSDTGLSLFKGLQKPA